MQNTLHHHPPQQDELVQVALRGAERGSALDRLSLRLGLWLLLRSSRRAQSRAAALEQARLRAHARLLDEYQREAAHARLLLETRSWR